MPMKLLIVSQYFWPEVFSINELVQSLSERGHDVEVLTGKPNYPEGSIFDGYRSRGYQKEAWGDVILHRLPLVPRGRKSRLRLALNYLSFVVSGMLLAPWILKGRRYDAIFVYAPSPILQAIPALFLGQLKRVRVAVWVQDLWPQSLSATGYVKNTAVLKAVEWSVRLIYRRADVLLVQSRAFQSHITALAPGKAVVYHPNSADAKFCEPMGAGITLPAVPELDCGFPVVFAGNVGAGQAVEVIVEAAELLHPYPEIRFIVFGQGSRWEWLREQVQTKGLTNLHLPGRFPVNTMPGLMQKASALLVTLTGEPIFALTVPNKVQAYMAAGRPILACLNGEGARIVEEAAAGLSVPAGDAKALAAAVLRLYRMLPEQRAEMGANGRRYFKEHFDHDKLIDELVAHLQAMTMKDGMRT